MSNKFNADEILEMAEQIERNGVLFYRAAAEQITDPQQKKLLLGFATMEEHHEKVFSAMRGQLSPREREPTVFDPDSQMGDYLNAMADGNIFDIKADQTASLTGRESMEDILQMAIGKEKDSVIFYLGMQDMVPASLGKDRIDAIIMEEMNHIGILSARLAALKS